MSKNTRGEVVEFLYRYLYGKETPIMGSDKKEEEIICQVLENPIEREEPDAYAMADDGIYLIEHFRFNASRENRAGSSLDRELAIADKNNKLNTITQINPPSSLKDYINNLVKHFERHAQKYDKYKENINKISDGNNLKGLVFLIQDETLFGAVEGNDLRPIELILTSEFMSVWRRYDFVKYIIIGMRCLNSDHCKIYTNKCTDIQCGSIYERKAIIMNQAFECRHEYEISTKEMK